MPNNEEDLSGTNEMSKNSNDEDDGGSGEGVRDIREDNAKQWRRFERQ
jgi:hypothetical protein